MRCEDLTRELASPTGKPSPAEMAGHLADCPGCAEWSRRVAHLNQIWEATRPPEPTEAALDALWASASLALDAAPGPATLRLEGLTHRRRGWAKPTLVAAQAAAVILLAALFLFRRGGVEPRQVALVTPVNVVVEPGETVVLRIGADAGHQIESYKEPTSDSSAIPEYTQFDVSRGVEAMLPNDWGSVASR